MTHEQKVILRQRQKAEQAEITDRKQRLFTTYQAVLKIATGRRKALLAEQEVKFEAIRSRFHNELRQDEERIHKETAAALKLAQDKYESSVLPYAQEFSRLVRPLSATFDDLIERLHREYLKAVDDVENRRQIDKLDLLQEWFHNEVAALGLKDVKVTWVPEPPRTEPCSVCGKMTDIFINDVPYCQIQEYQDRVLK